MPIQSNGVRHIITNKHNWEVKITSPIAQFGDLESKIRDQVSERVHLLVRCNYFRH